MADARYKPEAELDGISKIIRASADMLAAGWHTDALHEIGSFYFEKAGFASIPRLTVTVWCKEADMSSLIPILRQAAQAHVGERGWASRHIAVTPSVGRGRERMFTDQHGKRRRGIEHKVSFELSPELTAAIDWYGYRKVVTVRENGLPV